MESAHRAVVPRIHSLEQIESLRAAHLADDDPLGAHAQAILDEVSHRDLTLALEIRRAGFQAHDVRLLQLKLRRVLAGNHAFSRFDKGRQAVQQRRLA